MVTATTPHRHCNRTPSSISSSPFLQHLACRRDLQQGGFFSTLLVNGICNREATATRPSFNREAMALRRCGAFIWLGFDQVDATACFCRVDAGLKTVAGARKFVPGSKICIQPDIKTSVHPTKQKTARCSRNQSQSALFPGLPDDLAIACFIRVPLVEHRKLRLVCRRWYRLLAGNFFYSLWKSLGIAHLWPKKITMNIDPRTSNQQCIYGQ